MKTQKPKDNGQSGRNAKGERTEAGRPSMAVRYVEAGVAVVPLHGKKKGICTCGDPACDQVGKHPRTEGGVRDATTDSKQVDKWWQKWPKAKIGIAFGRRTKLIGLEIVGDAGWTGLRELIGRHEDLPRTVTILDGEDREVRLFRCDSNCTRKSLAVGLRVLGDDEFVIAPSSIDEASASPRFREKGKLGKVEVASTPRWLVERATSSSTESTPSGRSSPANPTIVLVPTSEIEPAPVTWIWPGVIATGRVTSLVGHPGLGKSQVTIDVAATISTGRPWPRGAANERAGHALILSAEDDAADTIVPRLIAAAADRTAVHLVMAVKGDDGVERAFSLTEDLERLEHEHDLQQVRLLIVDPITAYLGKKNGVINRNHGSEVRPLLDRLAAFAARHDLGVLAISHLNKSGGAKAITRIMGSLDFAAVARAIYLVTKEPGSTRRLLLPVKNNLAPDRIGYAFELEGKVVGEGVQTSAVKWSDDPVTISADEALSAAGKRSSDAVDFLRETLSEGPIGQAEIMRRGGEVGFTEKSLRTARGKLGAISKREGGIGADGRWVWHPSGGAKVLKLVVDSDKTAPMAEGEVPRADQGADATPSITPSDPAAFEEPKEGV